MAAVVHSLVRVRARRNSRSPHDGFWRYVFSMTVGVRTPAVAGAFYPAGRDALLDAVHQALAAVDPLGPVPKALIVPHAGYVYSGLVAASAYGEIAAAKETIRRVVMMGPSHRDRIDGFAVAGWASFRTPLGDVAVDRVVVEELLALPKVRELNTPHRHEHCLEVQLPFLQEVLEDFTIVPILAGDATADEVAAVLDAVWGGPETLIVISSDLSHYHSPEAARELDAATSRAIEMLDPAAIGFEQACGRVPITGLLTVARRRGLQARTLDLRNSGDTAGPSAEVVGYGAYAFV